MAVYKTITLEQATVRQAQAASAEDKAAAKNIVAEFVALFKAKYS